MSGPVGYYSYSFDRKPAWKPYKHFGWHTDKIFNPIWHQVLLKLRHP